MTRMYSYKTPSYVPEDDHQGAASYRAVLDGLVENSSAHGLPTFYRAIGKFVFASIFAHGDVNFGGPFPTRLLKEKIYPIITIS